MKAVQFNDHGTTSVLHVVDTETPRPGAGEVLVRVISAGINPFESKVRSGAMAEFVPVTLPSGIGVDAAGTVTDVGEGVEDVQPGDVVFGSGRNTLAEEAVLQFWTKIPAGVDPIEAGGWNAVVETAGRALDELGVTSGTILVSGASGGVGSAVVQLARGRGLDVVGTASAKNQDYLAGLGAVPVVYGDELVERVAAAAPEGIDAALDISGAGVIPDLIAIVGDAAKVLSIADFAALSLGAKMSQGAPGADPRKYYAEALALPAFALNVDRQFSLSEAGAAYDQLDQGHTVGKIVVTP